MLGACLSILVIFQMFLLPTCRFTEIFIIVFTTKTNEGTTVGEGRK